MSRRTLRLTARVFFDILLFLLICFAEFAIHRWFQPFHRGFFCNDPSLQYPYQENTFGFLSMAILALIVPVVVITVVELFKSLEANSATNCYGRMRKVNGTPIANGNGSNLSNSTGATGGKNRCHIGYRLIQCYKQLGYFLFGLALTLLATDIGKFSIGRLRPHFFAVCKPKLANGAECGTESIYITDYTCEGGDNVPASIVHEANRSFPSGHSSILFYALLYLCFYLQVSLSTRASKLLKHVLQFVFIMIAYYVALTRISDYHHHWSDVLSGSILGIVIAVVMAVFVSDFFARRGRYANGFITRSTFNTNARSNAVSNGSAGPKSNAGATATLPAYTFGTLPYLHYATTTTTAHHPHQYSQASAYQNYGYVP